MAQRIGYAVTPPLVSLVTDAMGPDRDVKDIAELAVLTGLNRGTLSLILRHKRNFMHADTARRIAEALDIDLGDLRDASRRHRRKPRSRATNDAPDISTAGPESDADGPAPQPEPQDTAPVEFSVTVMLPPRARRLTKAERVTLIATLRDAAASLTDAALDA